MNLTDAFEALAYDKGSQSTARSTSFVFLFSFFFANSLVYWLAYVLPSCYLRLALHGQTNDLAVFAMCISVFQVLQLVTTELVILFVGGIGMDTGRARCRWLEMSATIAATGTTPDNATAGCSHLCQAISQALKRATGTLEGTLLHEHACVMVGSAHFCLRTGVMVPVRTADLCCHKSYKVFR